MRPLEGHAGGDVAGQAALQRYRIGLGSRLRVAAGQLRSGDIQPGTVDQSHLLTRGQSEVSLVGQQVHFSQGHGSALEDESPQL